MVKHDINKKTNTKTNRKPDTNTIDISKSSYVISDPMKKKSKTRKKTQKQWYDCREYTSWIHGKSPESKITYKMCMGFFVKWSQTTKTPIKLINELIKMPKKKLNKLLENYVMSLKVRHSTARLYLATIQSFLLDYEITIPKRIVKKLPAKTKPAGMQAYTLEMVQRMLQSCTTARGKITILLMATTTMRRGALAELKMKDLIPVEDCYLIVEYRGTTSESVTYCTPECRKLIDEYFQYRTDHCGETITPESKVFKLNNNDDTKNPKKSINATIELALKKAKIQREKVGTNRYNIALNHGFRKFANTMLHKAKVDSDDIEKLMSHKNGLKGLYYDSTSPDIDLFEEYKKAIPFLTILPENRQKLEIQELKNRSVNDEVATAKQLIDMKKTIDELQQKMEDMEQQKESKERVIALYENDVTF